jgi:hypothetical protein
MAPNPLNGRRALSRFAGGQNALFLRKVNGLPNDGCGAQISPSQSSLDTPPVAILAKRGSLLSDRDLNLSLRQRRNDGSDSRQLSIQSRLQLLEGGLDFRWPLAIALIDEQSDYAIDFVRNGACCHFDLL